MTSPSVTTHWTVSGMTCAHCAASVTEELGEVDGVRDVHVDVSTGAVVVVSDRALTRDQVARAVDEAGYALAG